jgi:pectate lyase
MKIITFFSAVLVTVALATQARANDSANTTAPEGGFKGNGKSAETTAPTGGGGGTDHGSGFVGNGKKVNLSGEAMCAKCVLHDGSTCQTVIQTKHHGTTETYYVAQNDLAKKLHEDVCQTAHKVKVTGFVDEAGGKQQLTLTKLTVKEK